MFILKHKKLDNEQGGEQGGGGGGEQSSDNLSPNADYKNDPKLDDNGNPIEGNIDEGTPEGEQSGKGQDSGNNEGDKSNTPEFDFNAPIVQQIETLVTDAGLDASEVAKIVTENDGQVTPALLKTLVEKHGEAVASLIAQQLGSFHKANKEKATKRDQAVFDQVSAAFKDVTDQSGTETWKELSTWAKDNVPNEERKEINKMLQRGGLSAKYAVDDLVSRFKSSDNFSQEASLITGDNTNQSFGIKPMSKSDYTREFRALEAKGHVYGQSAELAALDKRREAGMQRGI